MRPIGFVKRYGESVPRFTQGKIYPYFEIIANDTVGIKISIKNDYGEIVNRWMFDNKESLLSSYFHRFRFHHYPEFPEDISTWTEDDWLQYHLKYGE